MNTPKISVIIPVYNVEKYLGECLDSIVNQTLKDIEIICVNDGSTDNSLSILKEYASKDERIKIINKENEGQGYARKVGLDNATGEYILFCDSDDYYSELMAFEKLYFEISKNKSELMIFRFLLGNEKNNLLDQYKENEDINKSILIFNLYYAPWFKIYKKSFLDRYDSWCFPKYLRYQDIPFHIQSCLRAKTISFSNLICYYYRNDNPTNVTNSKKGRKQIENICEIMLLVYSILKKERYLDKYSLEFAFLVITQLRAYFNRTGRRTDLISLIKNTFDKLSFILDDVVKEYHLNKSVTFPYLSREYILFYKLIVRLDLENLCIYIENKKIKLKNKLYKHIDNLEKHIKEVNKDLFLNNTIKNLDKLLKERDEQLAIKNQVIKQLQNSWSYRIGRLITYPLSIPFDFVKFIRNYNLIKKSNLFDKDYYLSQNEDVKKAKVDPIKHYLKFGWKEGRNPSAKFNGDEYLNKRPDVRVANICPLVHYIKFGKDEK